MIDYADDGKKKSIAAVREKLQSDKSLAGSQGFEPRQLESESRVLPLDEEPVIDVYWFIILLLMKNDVLVQNNYFFTSLNRLFHYALIL